MELLGQIRGALTADAVRRTSQFVGEDESRTRRAIGQFVPTVMAATINYVSTQTGAYSFLCMMQEGRHVGELLGELPSLLSNRNSARAFLSVGERAVAKLMGDQTRAVVHAVSEECSMEFGAAMDLLHLTTLAMLGVLGREMSGDRMQGADVIRVILEQRRVAARALPPEVARFIELYENPPGESANEIAPANWSLRKLKLFRLFLLEAGGSPKQ